MMLLWVVVVMMDECIQVKGGATLMRKSLLRVERKQN